MIEGRRDPSGREQKWMMSRGDGSLLSGCESKNLVGNIHSGEITGRRHDSTCFLLRGKPTDKVITFEQERHQPEDGNCPHLTRLGNGDGLVVKLFLGKGLHLGTTKSSRPNI